MVRIIKDAAAATVAVAALILLLGDLPDAGMAAFVSAKIAGAALLYAAAKAMERNHPEWDEEDV